MYKKLDKICNKLSKLKLEFYNLGRNEEFWKSEALKNGLNDYDNYEIYSEFAEFGPIITILGIKYDDNKRIIKGSAKYIAYRNEWSVINYK